jgi:hypothetical protein
MDTATINRCLNGARETRRAYMGCFAADHIPTVFTRYPSCFVVNEDTSTSRGSHWVCINVRSTARCDYFDSYAVHPAVDLIEKFLKQFEHVSRNKRPLQSGVSTVCGQYTVYVLIQLSKGLSLLGIVTGLLRRKRSRDLYVQAYVNKRFALDLPLIDLRNLL